MIEFFLGVLFMALVTHYSATDDIPEPPDNPPEVQVIENDQVRIEFQFKE